MVKGPRDWGNIVERCLDRFCELLMVRFCQLLTFHLSFQLRLLVQAPRMGIWGDKCRVLSAKELSNGVLMLIEVRRDLFVSVCALGLTLVAVVVVEIWGEIPPTGEFVEISMGGMIWSAKEGWYGLVTFIEVEYDSHAVFDGLGLVPLALVVAEIWGEHSPHSEICAIFEVWVTG